MPWLLVMPVAALHLAFGHWWLQDQIGFGAADGRPARLDVAFVRELQPLAAPAPPVRPTPPRARAAAPRPAASAPRAPEASVAEAAPPAAAEVAGPEALPEQMPPPPVVDVAPLAATEVIAAPPLQSAAADPVPAAESAVPAALPHSAEAATAVPAAPAAPAFEWPPSTLLNYTLIGNFRGPVEGQASVQWRMVGQRYQMQLELGVGPFFAPLMSRSLHSDGLITPQGLRPQRFDEEIRMPLRSPRRLSVLFDGDRVRLPSGRELPQPAGVQDMASQFVQMTWLFTTQPEQLQVGRRIELPLALPRHVETWTYDIVSEQVLDTPLGPLPTLHVRARRPARPGNDLVPEFWVAPTLQYLPVRFLIRQDAETYVDLMLARAPRQAETAASAPR